MDFLTSERHWRPAPPPQASRFFRFCILIFRYIAASDLGAPLREIQDPPLEQVCNKMVCNKMEDIWKCEEHYPTFVQVMYIYVPIISLAFGPCGNVFSLIIILFRIGLRMSRVPGSGSDWSPESEGESNYSATLQLLILGGGEVTAVKNLNLTNCSPTSDSGGGGGEGVHSTGLPLIVI